MGLVRMPPRRWLGVHRCCGGFLLADTLTPLGPELPPEMPGNVTVRLVVECPEPRCPQHRLYDRMVPAPAGASLLDVLRAATVWGPHNFTYVAPHAGIGGDPLGSLAVTPGLATCPAPVPWSHPGPHRLAPLAADLPQRQQCRTRTLTPPLPPARFDTQDTPQGPFLSRVLGLEARQQKRSYWQLLTAPSTSLQMGE